MAPCHAYLLPRTPSGKETDGKSSRKHTRRLTHLPSIIKTRAACMKETDQEEQTQQTRKETDNTAGSMSFQFSSVQFSRVQLLVTP